MLSNQEIKYYTRQLSLSEIGEIGQERLKSAAVLVIGAGGLGCPVLQYLTGIGIGKIGIIDDDVVDISNIHRQLLYSINDIGQNKALLAKEKLYQLNPNIQIYATAERLTSSNALKILTDYDVIVDCTDNYGTRFLINDACIALNKPLVSGSIYRFEGQLTVFNYKEGPTLRCVFPTINENELLLNCSESGVINILPGIIGLLQANEVIKIILEYGNVLSGQMLVFNAQNTSFDLFNLKRDYSIDYSKYILNGQLNTCDYSTYCINEKMSYNAISDLNLEEENLISDYLVLDVREIGEFPIFNGDGIFQIPLSELSYNIDTIPIQSKIIVVCKSGIRSLKAIDLLNEKRNDLILYNLENGLTEQFIEKWKKLRQPIKTVLNKEL